eukprot:TRINITY_DN4590_c2_g1_i1.p1 TRINITY_DN4590_c2_g1~~TRINITY_DN4590_c2_g1_i1.p1  ORF type:complete len:183 (-),score=53.74 TRINITY_DN4590_c2_g1_i1:114-662(-)
MMEPTETEGPKDEESDGSLEHESLLFDIIVTISLLGYICIIFAEFWYSLPSSFQACDRPLKLFVYVSIPPQILLWILLARIYLVFSRRMKANRLDSFNFGIVSVLGLFIFSWMIVGGFWLFKSDNCKTDAHQLYNLSLSMVVVFVISIGFNFCCLPIWMACYSRVKKNRFDGKKLPSMPESS